ncbi:MAG: hypothetical protein ACREBG_16550 [Pyrinomonadaceae bacterium]
MNWRRVSLGTREFYTEPAAVATGWTQLLIATGNDSTNRTICGSQWMHFGTASGSDRMLPLNIASAAHPAAPFPVANGCITELRAVATKPDGT